MVNSVTIKNDLSSIDKVFSDYDSQITELSSSWKGLSHDKIVSSAVSFSDEYKSGLQTQMNDLASACDLYEKFLVSKKNYEYALHCYNVATIEDPNKSDYSLQMNKYSDEMDDYKKEINVKLGSVKGIVLTAKAVSIGSFSTAIDFKEPESSSVAFSAQMAAIKEENKKKQESAVSSNIKSAIDWAVDIANDNTHGYSQYVRWGGIDYDCSSLVLSAYKQAGIDVGGATYTGNMRSKLTKMGFTWMPLPSNSSELQPGDILLQEGHHTEMYIGDNKLVGAHVSETGSKGGKLGDQTGSEISVQKYSNKHWDGVLRYTGKK